jgi:hypothetical protein
MIECSLYCAVPESAAFLARLRSLGCQVTDEEEEKAIVDHHIYTLANGSRVRLSTSQKDNDMRAQLEWRSVPDSSEQRRTVVQQVIRTLCHSDHEPVDLFLTRNFQGQARRIPATSRASAQVGPRARMEVIKQHPPRGHELASFARLYISANSGKQDDDSKEEEDDNAEGGGDLDDAEDELWRLAALFQPQWIFVKLDHLHFVP